MRCSKCGTENPDRAKFCVECAAPFARRCPSCGAENPPHAKFCLECSKPLGSAGSQSRSAGESANSPIHLSQSTANTSLEGERKTVTALFADIKGSMELMEDLDPEEARTIVDPALKLMMDAAQHYGGYIVQSTGDGIFALFGAPVAHEDHPQRALFAALRVQDQLKRYSDTLRGKGRLPLQARVGLHTGEVVMRSLKTGEDHVETTPIGHAISLAARMQVLAPVGSIAATEATRKLGEGYFTFKSLGPAVVKGVSEPVEVFEVTGLGPLRTRLQRAASRGYTKFVGREREMEALGHAAELAQQGHGQIVAAVADAGVGKSRLFHEFKAKHQSGWMVLEAVSFSHGRATAYLPVIDLLQSYFTIEHGDDSRKRREKVNGKVLTLDRALENALPYLSALLGLAEGDDPLAGMDAQIRRQRTLDHIKRILLRESLNQPLMIVFEDLHWIDDETQAFLNLLADSIATARILLLVNYRPEYSHQWGSKSYYTQLGLDPLGKESAGEMLNALLGVSAHTIDEPVAALTRLIIEKTEGTPLFMEEIYQSLIEEGALARNGAVKLTRPLDALKIPPTVQDIIASRIDRLPAAEKELLQTLAMIGMEFTLALAGEVTKKPDDELNRMLSHLQVAELIYEQPVAGDTEYTFKHALTHDVAYSEVLLEKRLRLHERVGEAIELLYAEHLAEHYGELARHYRLSSNIAKAVKYLREAGEQAAARSAVGEAVDYLSQAGELLAKLEASAKRDLLELDILLALGPALMAARGQGAPEVHRVYARAMELARQDSRSSRRFLATNGLWIVRLVRGELETARKIAETLVEEAHRVAEPALQSMAHFSLGDTLFWLGEFTSARKHLESALTRPQGPDRLPPQLAGVDTDVWSGSYLAFNLSLLGYPDQAVKVSEESLRKAREISQLNAIAQALTFHGFVRGLRRDNIAAAEVAESALQLATERGLPFYDAIAKNLRGWILLEKGDAQSAISDLQEGIAAWRKVGSEVGRPWWMARLAEAYLRADRIEEGLSCVDEAITLVTTNSERQSEAELIRMKGELLLKSDADADAERCFESAIRIARVQSAKWWELRATVSLSRLLAENGRRDEARAMLSGIYNWFTEGFDTADLKEAKKLLDELDA